MKIGAFAKRNQVGIDTVRHYINLELLIPVKKNKQYEFDLQCQKDFDEILLLKGLGFTLLEIKNLFLVKHLGKMTSIQQGEYYKNIFLKKYENIRAEIEKLNSEKSRLEKELHELGRKNENRRFKMGIELNWLQFLCCDKCGGSLILSEAAVEDNMILSGRLKCRCGKEYTVRDGILFADTSLDLENSPPDVLSYLRHTDLEYLNHIYKSLEWNVQNIDYRDLSGQVILELGSGSGFFLRRIYDELPEDAVYIAVDHDFRKLRFLKEILEKADKRKKIFFVCCDFLHMPLVDRVADSVFDFSGSSNFSFDHHKFLLKAIDRYFKDDAKLLGSYIIFQNFSSDSLVPAESRPNFRIDSVKQQIEELGFVMQSEYKSNLVTKGGIYEDYFKKGEKVLTYSFFGKRLG